MLSSSNRDELANFPEMMTYLGKYIQNLSAITAPLPQFMKKDVSWTWEQYNEQRVEGLKLMPPHLDTMMLKCHSPEPLM